jgi:hypothetical protein
MKQWKSIAALAASLALPGCFEQPEMPKPVASRLPEKVCQQVSQGMAKLDASGTVVRTKPAEITIEEQAWLQLPETSREQITKIIAFDAACKAAEPPMEQTVIECSAPDRSLRRHSRESGNPAASLSLFRKRSGIPAFAGMTGEKLQLQQ